MGEPSKIARDNKDWIIVVKNVIFHEWTKGIKIQYHFIEELIADETVKV